MLFKVHWHDIHAKRHSDVVEAATPALAARSVRQVNPGAIVVKTKVHREQ